MKKIADSKTEQIQIVMPEDINGSGRLFGGRLVQWIDVVAAVVARRHSNCNVTTVLIDDLEFKAPAYVNDMVVLIGQLTHVGNTSMEICVDSFVESFAGIKTFINRAYVVMVALDGNDKPNKVPRLLIENDEEKKEWDEAVMRNEIRKSKKLGMDE